MRAETKAYVLQAASEDALGEWLAALTKVQAVVGNLVEAAFGGAATTAHAGAEGAVVDSAAAEPRSRSSDSADSASGSSDGVARRITRALSWGKGVAEDTAGHLSRLGFGVLESDTDVVGTLSVRIIQATNLKAKDRGGTSDPYVEVHVGAEVRRTKVVAKDLNPHWEETFEIPFTRRESFVRVDVFDENRMVAADFLGRAVVPLAAVGSTYFQQWYILGKRGPRSHVSGEVLVGLQTDLPVNDVLHREFQLVRQLPSITESVTFRGKSASTGGDSGAAGAGAAEDDHAAATVTVPLAQGEEVEDAADVILRSHTAAPRAAHSPGYLFLTNQRLLFVAFEDLVGAGDGTARRSATAWQPGGGLADLERSAAKAKTNDSGSSSSSDDDSDEDADYEPIVEVSDTCGAESRGLSTSVPLAHILAVHEVSEDPSSGNFCVALECSDFRTLTLLFRPPNTLPMPSTVYQRDGDAASSSDSPARGAARRSGVPNAIAEGDEDGGDEDVEESVLDAPPPPPATAGRKRLQRHHSAATLHAVATAVHTEVENGMAWSSLDLAGARADALRFYFRLRHYEMNRHLLAEACARMHSHLLIDLKAEALPGTVLPKKRRSSNSTYYSHRRVSHRHVDVDLSVLLAAGATGTSAVSKADALVKGSPSALGAALAPDWKLYDMRREYARQGVPSSRWRRCTLNENYELCRTYPSVLFVPASVDDDTVVRSATFRSKSRFPALAWVHPLTGASITRSSQPLVGLTGNRSDGDEAMLEAIRRASRRPLSKLLIVDARPKLNAQANRTQGKGYESTGASGSYENSVLQFMDIGNIHVMRKSLRTVRDLCTVPVETITNGTPTAGGGDSSWLTRLDATGWLRHLGFVLAGANTIVRQVDQLGCSVLVHCSDGWDRTAQLSALAQLLMDPFYRTITGFCVLIEKEWLQFGHKFADRTGWSWAGHASKERSPIFLQFLDCVHQVQHQFPSAFEFTPELLEVVADHASSGYFGTFLLNSQREREDSNLRDTTLSVWAFLEAQRARLTNGGFKAPEPAALGPVEVPGQARRRRVWAQDLVLMPEYAPRRLRLWTAYYLRWDSRAYQVRWTLESLSAWTSQEGSLARWTERQKELVKSRERAPPATPPPSLAPSISLVSVASYADDDDDEAAEEFEDDSTHDSSEEDDEAEGAGSLDKVLDLITETTSAASPRGVAPALPAASDAPDS